METNRSNHQTVVSDRIPTEVPIQEHLLIVIGTRDLKISDERIEATASYRLGAMAAGTGLDYRLSVLRTVNPSNESRGLQNGRLHHRERAFFETGCYPLVSP